MSAQTTARQTADHESESAPYKVGYRNPPRHTQFRKGQSGNPGGRPRRGEAERLKAITLAEAYRGVGIKDKNGVMQPFLAIQAVMRRQVELAMEGNVHAQRDLLRAVRTYEREDATAAAIDECADAFLRMAADLEENLLAARRATPTPPEKMSYYEAAQKISKLLRLDVPLDQLEDEDEAGDPGTADTAAEQETAKEPEEREPESGTAPAVPPVASQPAEKPPAAPPPHRPATRAATATRRRETRDMVRRRPDAVGGKAEPSAVFHPPQHGEHPLCAATAAAHAAPPAAGRCPSQGDRHNLTTRRTRSGTPDAAPSEVEDAGSRGVKSAVIPRRDDRGEAHVPARHAAKSAKVPDKSAVLRDGGRRSKRAARRQRGRSG